MNAEKFEKKAYKQLSESGRISSFDGAMSDHPQYELITKVAIELKIEDDQELTWLRNNLPD